MEKATPPAEPTPPAPNEPADRSGQVLGDFKLLRRLGHGGMGEVYVAEQVSLKRKVALKLLRPDLAANATSLHRFKAEAEAVARATHANIVQIYAVGQSDGLNYMALEYVEGRNLREFIQKKGPPDVLLALRIIAQVAAALQRASELGIIHRDIKPENILLTRKGEVKVADFGLSRCFDDTGQALHLTQSGVTMGTPLYMSPEQVEGKPVDHRTDIYSFGVTCYYMLTGQPPFRGQTPYEVAFQHVNKEPEPLADVRPDLPAELCAVVHKMMAKAPEARYQTGREILRDVGRVHDLLPAGAPSAALTSGSGLFPAASGEMPATASRPELTLPRRSRGWLALAALSVVLALAGGLAIGWYQHRPPPQAVVVPSVQPQPPADDPGPAKALFSAKEHEKELQRLVEKYDRPESPLDLLAGLKHSVDLGLFYLHERRLDDAERFFKKVSQANAKHYSYRTLGQLGDAMVLAFKDQPAESNKHFLSIVTEMEKLEELSVSVKPFIKLPPSARKEWLTQKEEKVETYRLLWKDNPPLREMVARALTSNFQNAPPDFPPRLELYRHPPKPVLKSAPPPPG